MDMNRSRERRIRFKVFFRIVAISLLLYTHVAFLSFPTYHLVVFPPYCTKRIDTFSTSTDFVARNRVSLFPSFFSVAFLLSLASMPIYAYPTSNSVLKEQLKLQGESRSRLISFHQNLKLIKQFHGFQLTLKEVTLQKLIAGRKRSLHPIQVRLF